ncbi:U6 small nuclear RNA (adenine-(43)-N(6))-methyltransferase [Arctopsyche grandis]|uniref:U6 small nuclear RNA (adenine-(43)-N(6))-methyltransferase n=1 Tax=Arctopsyche grandis TaxID=121162 RepID=UPI00406D96DA
MHPRNIYKTPPDFSKLAVKFPEFMKIVNIDLNGTVRIDFQDLNSLRILTRCLLHQDFDLNVDIPANKLVPTVPLRLNYLLWIEDLLNSAGMKANVNGIDIGTGASCIYPLIAAKQFKWKMIGTEIDKDSLNSALKNIKQNNLENYITVRKSTSDGFLISDCFDELTKAVDFCMCNPPFYSSTDEMDCDRNVSRAPPRNARSGSFEEIITPGGEEVFIQKLISESIKLKDSVRIYTTMLGHKKSLKSLLKIIRQSGIPQYTQTEFQQGKTTRWGLAWSFSDTPFSKQIQHKKEKAAAPISFIIPQLQSVNYSVKDVTKKVLEILNKLEIKIGVVEKTDCICTMELKAYKNTWSYQRRKRREIKMKNTDSSNNDDTEPKSGVPELDTYEVPRKKIKIQTSLDMDKQCDSINNNKIDDRSSTVEINGDGDSYDFLKAALCIRKDNDYLLLEIAYLSGSCGKDGVNQIVQYVKNNWI